MNPKTSRSASHHKPHHKPHHNHHPRTLRLLLIAAAIASFAFVAAATQWGYPMGLPAFIPAHPRGAAQSPPSAVGPPPSPDHEPRDVRGDIRGDVRGDTRRVTDTPHTLGVESGVTRIARAAYTRDLDLLTDHASPALLDHYGGKQALSRSLHTSLQDAPEVPHSEVRVLEAAPLNLFSDVIFYEVVLEDDRGQKHVVGMVLREPPDHAPQEVRYCHLFVENERFGLDKDDTGLRRSLAGTDGTCIRADEKPPESYPSSPTDKNPTTEAPTTI